MNHMNVSNNALKMKPLRYFLYMAAIIIIAAPGQNLFAQTNEETAIPPTDILASTTRLENFPANTNLPSLFLIGDSTVRNGRGRGDGGQWGWGDEIAPFFDTGKINVVNRALGGTTSRTFYRDLWPRVLAMLKPGDFVIMQFGTNGGPINETVLNSSARSRGTIKGIGDETEAITNIITKQFEIVHSFGWYEKQMIEEARSKGATPMVCSLIPRNSWRDDKTVRSNGDNVGGWAGQVAQSENAPFLDINEIIARQYDELGREKVNALFIEGAGPHTSLAGAQTNALCVVSALKGLKENPLANYFSEKADGVPPADLNQSAPASTGSVQGKNTPE
jgi:lysophospholipase L1-like esterase